LEGCEAEARGMTVYLASPYSHDDAHVRRRRFEAACRAAAQLMERGEAVFSPIAHSHPIEEHMGDVHDTEWWMRLDMPFMQMADELVILRLPGWDVSRGVALERQFFEGVGRPVRFMDPE
jgi:nucleoside 2-deoxyribosyltransferase